MLLLPDFILYDSTLSHEAYVQPWHQAWGCSRTRAILCFSPHFSSLSQPGANINHNATRPVTVELEDCSISKSMVIQLLSVRRFCSCLTDNLSKLKVRLSAKEPSIHLLIYLSIHQSSFHLLCGRSWSQSHLTMGERQGTAWTGHQCIAGTT